MAALLASPIVATVVQPISALQRFLFHSNTYESTGLKSAGIKTFLRLHIRFDSISIAH